MLNITFKYVGHGDSIIIEYSLNNQKKIGVIDVCKNEGDNAVLDHIIKESYDVIDFIIISHFHFDHCSGLFQLIKYCEEKKINISFFGYPKQLNKKIIKSLKISRDKKRDIGAAFHYAYKLYESGQIVQEMSEVNKKSGILSLDGKFKLSFLSPAIDEITEYEKSIFDSELRLKDKANHNLISTCILIESDEAYILLTSDNEFNTLKRIGRRILKGKDKNKSLVLAQVPHHGSDKNHYKEFWNLRNREVNTPAVISCGRNSYGHPSAKVISDFKDLSYNLCFTSLPKKSNLSLLDTFEMDGGAELNVNDLSFSF